MASVIRFACGTCHEKLSVPARYAGRKGVCPSCRAVNRVPAASETPASAVVAAPAARAVPAAAPSPREVGRTVQQPAPPLRDAGWDVASPPPSAEPVHRVAPPRDPGWDSGPPAAAAPAWTASPAVERAPAAAPASSPAFQPPAGASPSSSAAAAWPEDAPARTFSLFGWLRRSVGEADAPLRREWEVDRGGLPLPARLALLVLVVLAFVATLWGVIYGLLRLLVGGEE